MCFAAVFEETRPKTGTIFVFRRWYFRMPPASTGAFCCLFLGFFLFLSVSGSFDVFADSSVEISFDLFAETSFDPFAETSFDADFV